MTTYFENKEHYINFRKAWAAAVNSPRAKKTFIEEKNYQGGYMRVRRLGWLKAEHYMLFNLLRNRPAETGFTPVTNKRKLLNGSSFNYAVENTAFVLRTMVKEANSAISKGDMFGSTKLQEFLEPFDGTVTIQMLASITVPKIETLSPSWAKGRAVYNKIAAGQANPKTFDELNSLYHEVA